MICPGPIRLCPAQNDQKGVRATTGKLGIFLIRVFCRRPHFSCLIIQRTPRRRSAHIAAQVRNKCGTSAAQVRHKCGTSAAQVRHIQVRHKCGTYKCGTSAAQVRHKCGRSAAEVRQKCGTSAAQVRHKCGTSAAQVRPVRKAAGVFGPKYRATRTPHRGPALFMPWPDAPGLSAHTLVVRSVGQQDGPSHPVGRCS